MRIDQFYCPLKFTFKLPTPILCMITYVSMCLLTQLLLWILCQLIYLSFKWHLKSLLCLINSNAQTIKIKRKVLLIDVRSERSLNISGKMSKPSVMRHVSNYVDTQSIINQTIDCSVTRSIPVLDLLFFLGNFSC